MKLIYTKVLALLSLLIFSMPAMGWISMDYGYNPFYFTDDYLFYPGFYDYYYFPEYAYNLGPWYSYAYFPRWRRYYDYDRPFGCYVPKRGSMRKRQGCHRRKCR